MKTLKEMKIKNGENETTVKKGLYQDGNDYLVMTFTKTKTYKTYKKANMEYEKA